VLGAPGLIRVRGSAGRQGRSEGFDYPRHVPKLDAIRSALSPHQATILSGGDKRRAAVAMVLRERDGVSEVLFIERATREGDPWSGHMAFPGGRVDPTDASTRAAAERETREEVGLDLEGARVIGRLDDMQGHRAAGVNQMVISAFVYEAVEVGTLVPNHEVRHAFWFPLGSLHDEERQVEYPMRWDGRRFPGILVGQPERHIVWGLTYRFLEHFFEVTGRPLVNRWGEGWNHEP
jgi:8-oxo-dGTP pyrophosphatase MutT (NUDIX family)